MFKFYLDNILVKDPLNWDEFTETIERDNEIKGLLPRYDIKLTFSSDAYKYLYDQLRLNGYCQLVQLDVDYKCSGGFERILTGFIFISDCKFNLTKCTVECQVTDNNYGAKIFNNKSIKAYLNAGISKNGTTITPCSYDDVFMFTPSTGLYLGTTVRGYKVWDAFRFLIDFMSDGDLGFESDYLTTMSGEFDPDGLRIATGHELRIFDASTFPFISFQDLFKEIDKKYPLGFTVINVSGVPTIKIENADYFYNNTSSIRIEDINDLQESFNNEILYSSIKLGDPNAIDSDGTHSYDQIRFFNFITEEYHLQGACNIDKVLDLTSTFICDTNIIEGLVATDTSNDSYDDEFVLFQTYNNSGTQLASQTVDPTSGNLPFYYNSNLRNNEVASRYNLQGNIAIYLGTNNDLFLASSNIIQDMSVEFASFPLNNPNINLSTLIFFQNDSALPNFDTNNRYNNTTYRYTSPANGVYTFESNITALWFELYGATIYVAFNVYDSGSALQQTIYGPAYNFPASTGSFYNSTFNGTCTVYLPSGYYVEVHLGVFLPTSSITPGLINDFKIQPGSNFSCIASINGGGVYEAKNANDYFVSRFEFIKSLSYENYNSIKLDLSKSLTINDGTFDKKVWIRKLVRKLSTGEMEWELISNLDNS